MVLLDQTTPLSGDVPTHQAYAPTRPNGHAGSHHHRIGPGRFHRGDLHRARANLHPLVIEGIGAGGQLMLTTDVENYPGFPDGILGPELMAQFREQAVRFGAEFVTADAGRVDLGVGSEPGLGRRATEYSAHTVIISTGAKARMLGLDSERRLLGHGVSTCATCDGFFFRDKRSPWSAEATPRWKRPRS